VFELYLFQACFRSLIIIFNVILISVNTPVFIYYFFNIVGEYAIYFIGCFLSRIYIDGASLLYVSVREEKNCDLLSKYIAHRVYGLEFTSSPSVVDKDAVFV